MAIKRPDIYEHNNPVLAIVDSDFLKGGGRVVADLTELYGLSARPDQLKERVTRVYVTSESNYYTLVDDTNINNSSGWEADTAGGGTWGSITGTLSDQTDLQSALDGKVDENTAITGDTKTKITYDAKGLVTGGADATTADIADSTDKRYVTDSQLTVIGNTSGTNTGDNAVNSLYSGLEASKQDVITGGATTITDTDLTASRALTSDVSGKVAVSAVTADELDHMSGVTSPIQTQIDNKIAKYTTEYPGGSNKNIFSLVALSQAEYDALTPDADTIYFII